jgi:ABC-type transport system involved in multi-copper enzyme maturation permease subunit
MLLTLVRREIVGNVLSLRFLVTLILFFSLILVSVFVMTTEHAGRMQSYEASHSAHRDALSKIADIGEASQQLDELLLNQGVYGDIRPPELAVFVDGLSGDLPTQVHAAAFNERRVDDTFYENPVVTLFTSPDIGYIINIVVSLLALLFVFDAICGEKERGTLKITLSNSVPRDLVLLGKWIGGYVSLAAPFVVALLAGVAYVHLTGALVITDDILQRLLWMLLVSLLYVSLFFTLGLMISALTHRASTSLIISLFVWICWILVIPNLAPVIARIVYPVPSPEKIAAESVAIEQETDLRLQRVSQSTLSYGREGQKMQEDIRQEGERRQDKLERYYQEEFRAQTEASMTLSRLSPASSYRYATTELSGTGVHLFAGFRKGYDRFREDFEEYSQDLFQRRGDDRLGDDWFQKDEVPTFEIARDRLNDVLDRITFDLLLLVMYNLLFFMGSYMFFLRYDVT